MNAPKFTPGQWYVICEEVYCTVPEGGNAEICDAGNSKFIPDKERKANAALIAAAPELYAALEQIAMQCGPYAERGPALDYATISNIARFALAAVDGAK